jgi:hypothetical protein
MSEQEQGVGDDIIIDSNFLAAYHRTVVFRSFSCDFSSSTAHKIACNVPYLSLVSTVHVDELVATNPS